MLVMAILQLRGATFELNSHGALRCNLDGADISGQAEADSLSKLVLALRDEIKQLLREDRTAH